MSVAETAHSAGGKSIAVTGGSTDTDSEGEEVRKADAAWERIRKLIPETPFILTVPQDALAQYFHYSHQDAQSWIVGNLFDPDEEHLQYTTFQYREYGHTCFVCRSEVDEERERRARMKSRDPTAEKKALLQGSGSGKKVSLGAYLNKKATGTNGVTASQDDASAPVEAKPKSHAHKANGADTEAKDTSKDAMSDPPRSHKQYEASTITPRARSPADLRASSLNGALDTKTSRNPPNEHEAPPAKKVRRSPPAEPKKRLMKPSTPPSENPHDLPPLLSPTILPLKYDLPPLLSPTLPPIIQAELDKIAELQRQRAVSDTSTSSDKKSHPSQASKSPSLKPKDLTLNLSKETDERPIASARLPPASAKPRLIVKLKYGRKHRKEVERYLKLPQSTAVAATESKKARPTAGFSTKDREKTNDRIRKVDVPAKHGAVSAKDVINSNSTHASTAEKRPREDDSQPAHSTIKRHKASASVDLDGKPGKPRTPAQPPASSPAFSNRSSTQKSQQYLTPVKENKNISMIRSSSDQGTASTPGRSSLTPASAPAKQGDGKPAPTSVPPSKKAEDRAAWSNLSKQLNALGRSLKHELQRLAQSNGGKPAADERKKCAVLSLECILAYMAAYTCMDYCKRVQHQPSEVENTWRTLLPLWEEFRRYCKEFPHLDGLRLHLGAVCQSRISFIVAQRANTASKPEQAPTPGSSATDTTHEANFELLSKSFSRLVAIAAHASQRLPLVDIMEQYPDTWAKRAGKDVEPGEWEALPPGNLRRDGVFRLPLGVDTTPLMGVRFGLSFLLEWMQKEGLKYELQMQL